MIALIIIIALACVLAGIPFAFSLLIGITGATLIDVGVNRLILPVAPWHDVNTVVTAIAQKSLLKRTTRIKSLFLEKGHAPRFRRSPVTVAPRASLLRSGRCCVHVVDGVGEFAGLDVDGGEDAGGADGFRGEAEGEMFGEVAAVDAVGAFAKN